MQTIQEEFDSTRSNAIFRMSRRRFLKIAGVATGVIALGGVNRSFGQLPPLTSCGIQEVFPTSPFIVSPFQDPLPIPQALAPGWRPDPTLPDGQVPWTCRWSKYLATPDNPYGEGVSIPGPGEHRQDAYGHYYPGEKYKNYQGHEQTIEVEHMGTHQVWPTPAGPNFNRLKNWPSAGVEPMLYHIRLQIGTHKFTTSKVRPIDKDGNPVPLPDGTVGVNPLDTDGLTTLPDSVIYGFNGTFPGALINVEYGKPVLVRFENDLDKNPLNLDLQDFGAPDKAFLTHLHNGHTAPESDGQPHYMQCNHGGYTPADWVDNLYLNYPAGGDPAEMQSFLWFHDHRMHHTGANVYKGMVGLMPHYDPGIPRDLDKGGGIVPGTGLDTGNESDPAPNLKLPGIRTNNPDGSFNVKYDIPMAFYDCALDDGITKHADLHTPNADCGKTHPEWWGKTFFKHFPNHGFVGDIFTVNCVAFPVLHVYQRRYRLRFLGASIARIYELCFMTSAAGPVAMPGTQGQWQIPDGKQWKPMTRIASMGGLLPKATVTNTVHIWPASRREVVVDFSDAKKGDVIYLTNVLVMVDGRQPVFNDLTKSVDTLKYKVPLVKIIVDGPPPETDHSANIVEGTPLRPMPKLGNGKPITLANTSNLPQKKFTLTRGGPSDEEQWIINKLPFDGLAPLAIVVKDQPEVWTNVNGGGGWVHPMHMHAEEHTVLARIGSTLKFHPDDTGKEDVTNLEPSESVVFYRNFRTFEGRYVAHCHNLAHEDHNMMFGFAVVAAAGGMDITGKVADSTGAPFAGVKMALSGVGRDSSVITDAEGKYGFTGLLTGQYVVTPSLKGYKFSPQSKTVDYVSGHDNTGIDFVSTKKAKTK